MTEQKKTVGMYETENPEWPKVIVGNFLITRQDEKSVWIQEVNSGDGGSFTNEAFESLVKDFFDANL